MRHSFGLDHEEITALAATEAPGCSGVTFLPYLAGERMPNWPQATGTVLGECAPVWRWKQPSPGPASAAAAPRLPLPPRPRLPPELAAVLHTRRPP